MKRKLLAIVSFVLSLIMGVACLGGCNLVTTDGEKDMEQVVATVSIENGVEDKIYKQDLIIDYLNYGTYYVQYYGYTQAKTFKLILNSQINNKILVQNAMKELEADVDYEKNGEYQKWDVRRYLNEDNELHATYHVYESFNSMLDAFENDDDKNKFSDTIPDEVRTVPTSASSSSHDHDEDEMRETIEKGFDTNSTAKRREAFNGFVNFMKINNFLGDSFNGTDLTTTEYYAKNIKSERESELLENYNDWLKNKIRAEYTFEDLKTAFNSELEEQTKWSNADFVDALSNASAEEPVLYGVNGVYGYVYNLLLGVDSIQEERIEAIDVNLSVAEKEVLRKDILSTTLVKDLRTSWIESGYDFDYDSKKFTGKYTFTENSENSLAYQGNVTLLNPDKDEEETAEYKANANVMGLNEFIECMDMYMTTGKFEKGSASVIENTSDYSLSQSVFKGATYNNVAEYTAKINELLFAFSTDSGSLNTYKGYVIKPEVDGSNSEEYVSTFATAGRELISKGGQSYVVVASDYGYHIMFFSQTFRAGTSTSDNLVDYLNKEYGERDWEQYYNDMLNEYDDWEDTDNYMYVLLNTLSSVKVTNAINRNEKAIVNKYTYEKQGCVQKFEKAYSDLIK